MPPRLVFPVLLFNLLLSVYAIPQVKIGSTTLAGTYLDASKVDFFGGIPFAEPPVGPLRFRPPVVKTRLGVPNFNATSYGKACLQPPSTSTPLTAMSEDCLTINIYRPSGIKAGTSLPVLFWTYGGSFLTGASHIYNGSELVRYSVERGTPIIYVNFNYRLGPLGYPQGQEADDNQVLNLALRDQIAALKWVHANILYFGGDKHKVTLFGQSAGAIMTGVLFLNPELGKLARGAIFESGSSNGASVFKAADRQTNWQQFVKGVAPCTSLAASNSTLQCLRNATSSDIQAGLLQLPPSLTPGAAWSPTLDSSRNSLLPDFPSKLYAKGQFARLPFIAGTNLDEGTAFIIGLINPNVTDVLIKALFKSTILPSVVGNELLDQTVDQIVDSYPDDPAFGSPYNTGSELFGLPAIYKRGSAIQGDLGFDAPRRLWSQTASGRGVKTYGYQFTQPPAGANPALGVYHSAEIPFVYGIPQALPGAQNLSRIMMDYWVSFAVSVDPNDGRGAKRPTWPQYTPSNQVLLQLNGDNTTVIPDTYRNEQITLMNNNAIALRRRDID